MTTARLLKLQGLPTLKDCETALGEPAKDWAGRCFEIATKLVKLDCVPGVAVYGHYLGKIHPKSRFSGKQGLGFCQHGWVQLPDGRIFDPTRWAFENRKPYLYVSIAGYEYDEGGNKLRAGLIGRPPQYDPSDEQFEFSVQILAPKLWAHVEKLLHIDVSVQEPGYVSFQQLNWLANAHYDALQPYAAAIYEAIEKLGKGAYIPIDNARRAKREGG